MAYLGPFWKFKSCTVDGRLSWIEVQKLVIESCARDGEAFIRIHRNRTFQDSISLEIIEPDRVDEELSKRIPNGNEIRMGVELNQYKRPVAYHHLTRNVISGLPGIASGRLHVDFVTSMSTSPIKTAHSSASRPDNPRLYAPESRSDARRDGWFDSRYGNYEAANTARFVRRL